MSESQKFIARNRAPRVQIEYDVELYGSEKKVQLPFVMGVMSDLAGKSTVEQPPVADRKFLEIDVDNFDERMKAMAPRVAYSVPNTLTGEGQLAVDLTFESMDDFTPGAIAAKVDALRPMLEARQHLTNLLAYMDGKTGAETLIEGILANPSLLGALAGQGALDNSETDAALARLRDMMPADPEPDADASDSVLDGLRAAAPSEGAPVEDATDDVLGNLAQNATADAPAPDSSVDVLADLAAQAPEPEQEGDDTQDVLSNLAAQAPSEPEPVSDVDNVLDGIASVPDAGPDPDSTAAALDSLAAAPVEEVSEDDGLDDILGDLAQDVPDEPEPDDAAAALDSLAAAPVEEVSEDDGLDDILGDLAQDVPDEPESDDAAAALDSLAAAPVEEVSGDDGLDDILGDLALDAPDEAEADQTAAALDSLSSAPVEETAGGDALDDILGDLSLDADVVAEDPADQKDDLDDILGDLLGDDDGADPVEALVAQEVAASVDGLDDLLAPSAGDPLDELLADSPEITAPADDGLDDLLAESDGDPLDDLLGDTESDTNALDALDDLLSDSDTDPIEDLLGEGGDGLDDLQVAEPEFAFGALAGDRPAPEVLNRKRFRIAVMGDFSGRAARNEIETGEALGRRAAVPLDPDTVEDIIAGFAKSLILPLGSDGAGVEVRLRGLDDMHPDELYENVALFSELSGLRSQLQSGATAANAAERLTAWGQAHGVAIAPPKRNSAATSVPADLKLSDFQRLIGDSSGALSETGPIDDLIAQIVGPHVRQAPDADAQAMVAAVDQAISTAMRLVLHHPDFQALEAQWRSLDLLARSIEVDDRLEVMLYDVSAEEIAADLASADDLGQSGMARLLTEEPLDPETGRGGYSAIVGLYTFEETPPHAELLGRLARVAAHVDAPFFAALTPNFLEISKEDRHPLVAEAWDTLRAMPEAVYIGLAAPRFMLRRPYGAKSEPIYEFDFEEFSMAEGLKGLLWANPVILVAILMARSYRQNGQSLDLGSVMSLGGIPYHYVNDHYGDQVALPCTERNLTLEKVEHAMARGLMPVVWVKGRDEIRLASFQSLGGDTIRGPWSDLPPPAKSPPVPKAPDPVGDGSDDTTDALGDLDDLLAEFSDEADLSSSVDSGSGDIDAELAALLEDL